MILKWLEKRRVEKQVAKAKAEAAAEAAAKQKKKELHDKLQERATELKAILIEAGFKPLSWCNVNKDEKYVEIYSVLNGQVFVAKIYERGGLSVVPSKGFEL